MQGFAEAVVDLEGFRHHFAQEWKQDQNGIRLHGIR